MKPERLVDRVARFLSEAGVLPEGQPVIAGVSGGLDSMALLDLLVALSYKPVVVHINYGLRGTASDRDQQIVADYCSARNISLESFHPDSALFQGKRKSLQERARDYRYTVFAELAEARSAQAVLLAHHADDNAETILQNIFRGAGLEGLAGIPTSRELATSEGQSVLVLRPLLEVSRNDILEYATDRQLQWGDDTTNMDSKYARGFIRSKLRPLIEEGFSESAFANIAASGSRVRAYLQSSQSGAIDQLFETTATENRELRIEILDEMDTIWRHRIILEALTRWYPEAARDSTIGHRIAELIGSQVGRTVVYPGVTVTRERDVLRFEVPQEEGHQEYLIPSPGHFVSTPAGCIRVDRLAEPPATYHVGTESIAFASGVQFPLVIRHWEEGDRMVMFRSRQNRKVSDILTDRKLPTLERSRTLVMTSGGDLIWIPGVARSDHYKIESKDSDVLLMSYIKTSL